MTRETETAKILKYESGGRLEASPDSGDQFSSVSVNNTSAVTGRQPFVESRFEMNAEAQFTPADAPFLVRVTCDVVAVVFVLITFVVSYHGLYGILKSWSDSCWPEVAAEVLQSEVISLSDGKVFEPRITYAYEIAGQRFESTSVEVVGSRTKYDTYASSLVRRLPKGSITKAKYNPKDPSESYLLTGIRFRFVVIAAAPWLFFALFFCWLKERLRSVGRRDAGLSRDA